MNTQGELMSEVKLWKGYKGDSNHKTCKLLACFKPLRDLYAGNRNHLKLAAKSNKLSIAH